MTFTRQVARHARDDRPEHCEQCTRPIKKGQGWVLVQALGVGNGPCG